MRHRELPDPWIIAVASVGSWFVGFMMATLTMSWGWIV